MIRLATLLALLLVAAPAWAQPQAPTPITTLVGQIVALYPRVEGDVLKVDGGQITLSVGKRDGVVTGVELSVYHEGETLKHPKTGEVLGRTEKMVGQIVVSEVAETYAVARVTQGSGIQPGDKARVSAGKVKLTIVPLSTGVRDTLIEAAIQELVDGLSRSGRFSIGMGDAIAVSLTQQGIKPEEALEGKGLAKVAERYKAENILAVHFKRVETKPYMDVRLYGLPQTDPALSTAFFVPPSIRPTTQGSRFSQGGPANPPQAKQRSLLARLLGRELEAGSYSSGENTIPLKEVAKFPFAVLAGDVALMPKDKIPRMVVSDGEKVYQYKIVGQKFEPEWSMSVRSRGRVISVYFVDLDGDGVFEVVGNRHDPKSGLNNFIIGAKDGKPRYLDDSIEEFLFPVDIKGDGYKQTVWTQRFSREKLFTDGQAEQMAWKNGKLVTEKAVKVHQAFRPMGAVFSNMNGKDSARVLAFIDEFNRLQMSVDGEDLWRSGTAVGGGGITLEQETGQVTNRVARTAFYKIEPTPLAIDLDGDGVDEVIVPQNIVKEGLLAIVYKGPAGFRLQSIDTGFEGTITAMGGFKTDDATQPTLIATVVRYKNILKTSAETQIIMTVPQE
ncbi:MAG TPA: hypothetical protein VMI34_05395 [Candidatus Bathyarchaeia archaeon]|nr:hypothetical protein [Candidatus Bathyarchaeia archaeon]